MHESEPQLLVRLVHDNLFFAKCHPALGAYYTKFFVAVTMAVADFARAQLRKVISA